MLHHFALFFSFLFVSAVLAAPSPRYGTHMARRREGRQSQFNDRLEQSAALSDLSDLSDQVIYSSNWAGALWDKDNGTFTSVTGTFTVPMPSGESGDASVWVGIDGDTCMDAILQTGVDLTVSDGLVSYDAWYEWYPDYAQYFSDTEITISAGDVVRLTVVASSTTTGTATIENLTTGQGVAQGLSSSFALCQQNAEWIVEDFQQGGSLTPFVNFGTVTFTNAETTGVGSYTPSGATMVNMKQNSQVLTSVSIEGSSATVKYV